MKLFSPLLMGIALLSTSTAGASGEYVDQVKSRLGMVQLAALSSGWEETHNEKIDSLRQGGADTLTLNMRRGTSYKIITVCDDDCDDIDLKLYDEDGDLVSKDEDTSSYAVVDATPRWTGRYSLKVEMYKCSDSPCYYGVSVVASN